MDDKQVLANLSEDYAGALALVFISGCGYAVNQMRRAYVLALFGFLR